MAISALQSLELIERLHAYDSVQPPAPENENSMRWVGTALSIAGVPLLVAEGELEEIIETPTSTAIPGTKPWGAGCSRFQRWFATYPEWRRTFSQTAVHGPYSRLLHGNKASRNTFRNDP